MLPRASCHLEESVLVLGCRSLSTWSEFVQLTHVVLPRMQISSVEGTPTCFEPVVWAVSTSQTFGSVLYLAAGQLILAQCAQTRDGLRKCSFVAELVVGRYVALY